MRFTDDQLRSSEQFSNNLKPSTLATLATTATGLNSLAHTIFGDATPQSYSQEIASFLSYAVG